MQDRPSAGELLDAVRGFLESEILPNTSGRRQFHTRVSINVLNILRREWDQEERMVLDEWRRLASLLDEEDEPSTSDDTREGVRRMNAEVSKRIRAGELDDRWDEAVAAIAKTVKDKLLVANPGYMEEQP